MDNLKNMLIPIGVGGVVSYFLWQSHRTLAYIAVGLTAIFVVMNWRK